MPPEFGQRGLPAGGAWRVHPAPAVLPRLSHEGPGRNRYDDPWGHYTVRYVAENLTGALLETMARFRPAPEAEALLAGVIGVENGDVDHPDPADGVSDWLAAQHIGRVTVAEPTTLVDVHDPQLLLELDKHPLVRTALEASDLGTPLSPARLDEAVVRLGGPVGRPVTQALSRAVRERYPHIGGVAYRSRLDDDEWCWALWDDTPVEITISALTASRRHHRRAITQVARALEIPLPAIWL